MHDDNLTRHDLHEAEERGLTESEIRRQIALFRNPPPPARLVRPCTIGRIVRLSPEEHPRLFGRWEEAAVGGRLSKFVPASGAASRMFESLDTTTGGIACSTTSSVFRSTATSPRRAAAAAGT